MVTEKVNELAAEPEQKVAGSYEELLARLMVLEAKEKKRDEAQSEEAAKKAELREKIKEEEAYLNEEVTIMLPKIPVDGYKEPVFVSVNGKSCRIERGVPVKIKRKYANLLTQSQIQDAATVNLMENEANRYATDELTTK